ncbi:MAG: hypothetical protein KAI16_00790 [Candidatus Pacebacteria bacterium]|nr:hypothetical protein [Candidatus Paceibacterota bacterium]
MLSNFVKVTMPSEILNKKTVYSLTESALLFVASISIEAEAHNYNKPHFEKEILKKILDKHNKYSKVKLSLDKLNDIYNNRKNLYSFFGGNEEKMKEVPASLLKRDDFLFIIYQKLSNYSHKNKQFLITESYKEIDKESEIPIDLGLMYGNKLDTKTHIELTWMYNAGIRQRMHLSKSI